MINANDVLLQKPGGLAELSVLVVRTAWCMNEEKHTIRQLNTAYIPSMWFYELLFAEHVRLCADMHIYKPVVSLRIRFANPHTKKKEREMKKKIIIEPHYK